ncbi:MAG: FHA domain-containing protein [Lachnospiraceae bacterium]|nr:FHA domain-containing protein [Lachnospiraceae bacterium]
MNFLSQLGILAVILIILVILIKSNQTLEKIYMEEEKREQEPKEDSSLPEFEIPKLDVSKITMPKLFGKKKKKDVEQEQINSQSNHLQPNHSFAKESGESSKVSRSQPTMPMEKENGIMIEVLDERGRAKETIKVSAFPYTIGRNEENDLVLDDLSVSSFHAQLEEEGDWIVLKDSGSLNKLMVNGKQEVQVPVSGEVEVGFGNTTLRFLKEVRRSNPTQYYAGTSLMEEWR